MKENIFPDEPEEMADFDERSIICTAGTDCVMKKCCKKYKKKGRYCKKCPRR
ncbi:MAG: hypothetical protein P8X57_02150 [Cyclobacteriaceae bacterium]